MDDSQKEFMKKFALIAGLVGAGYATYKAVTKKKIFISFDWDHDKHYRFLLNAWDQHSKFNFEFEDMTPEEIQSNDVGVVKAAITRRINDATHTLVLIGENADTPHWKRNLIGHKNWICFEVAKSKELGKKIVAVKIDQKYTTPNEVLNSGASWAKSFNFESVKRAIDEA